MAPFVRQKPIDCLRAGAIQAFTPTCTFQFIIFCRLLLRFLLLVTLRAARVSSWKRTLLSLLPLLLDCASFQFRFCSNFRCPRLFEKSSLNELYGHFAIPTAAISANFKSNFTPPHRSKHTTTYGIHNLRQWLNFVLHLLGPLTLFGR